MIVGLVGDGLGWVGLLDWLVVVVRPGTRMMSPQPINQYMSQTCLVDLDPLLEAVALGPRALGALAP